MTDDPNRIDLTRAPTSRIVNVHLRGYYGDEGENEGVLSVTAMLTPVSAYPETGRIIVGSPKTSPLIEGHIPDLGSWSCGPDAADRLADELKAAAAAARKAMEAGR